MKPLSAKVGLSLLAFVEGGGRLLLGAECITLEAECITSEAECITLEAECITDIISKLALAFVGRLTVLYAIFFSYMVW